MHHFLSAGDAGDDLFQEGVHREPLRMLGQRPVLDAGKGEQILDESSQSVCLLACRRDQVAGGLLARRQLRPGDRVERADDRSQRGTQLVGHH